MKDYEVMVGWFEKYEDFNYVFFLGLGKTYLFHISVDIVIVHSSPYLCVYGDDQIICDPGADDVTGELGAA